MKSLSGCSLALDGRRAKDLARLRDLARAFVIRS
jgi:hypothetical protein